MSFDRGVHEMKKGSPGTGFKVSRSTRSKRPTIMRFESNGQLSFLLSALKNRMTAPAVDHRSLFVHLIQSRCVVERGIT